MSKPPMDKPALIDRINRVGLQDIEFRLYVCEQGMLTIETALIFADGQELTLSQDVRVGFRMDPEITLLEDLEGDLCVCGSVPSVCVTDPDTRRDLVVEERKDA